MSNGTFQEASLKNIYGIVCSELGLSDQGTKAKAVGFKSFKDMGELF